MTAPHVPVDFWVWRRQLPQLYAPWDDPDLWAEETFEDILAAEQEVRRGVEAGPAQKARALLEKHQSGHHDQRAHGRRGPGAAGGPVMEGLEVPGSEVGYASPWGDTEGERVRQQVAGMKDRGEIMVERVKEHDAVSAEISARNLAYDALYTRLHNEQRAIDPNKDYDAFKAKWNEIDNARMAYEKEDKRLWDKLDRLQKRDWPADGEALPLLRDPAAWRVLTKDKPCLNPSVFGKADASWGRRDAKRQASRYNKAVDGGVGDAGKLYSAKGRMQPGDQHIGVSRDTSYYSGGRAYYTRDQGGTIHAAFGTSRATFSHEYGHHIEAKDPVAAARAQKFLDRRTSSSPMKPLRELTGNSGYEADEHAQKDRFSDPYVGKFYKDPGAIRRAPGHSEVLSMGVQYMVTDPVGFARKDPDHFVWTYNTLKGVSDGDG